MQYQDSPLINISIYLTYVLFVIALIAAIVFPLIQTFSDLKKAKGTLIGIVALVGVLLLAFLLSPAETGPFYDKFGISPTGSKVIGGGLLGTYLVFAGAVISILYTEIVKWFK